MTHAVERHTPQRGASHMILARRAAALCAAMLLLTALGCWSKSPPISPETAREVKAGQMLDDVVAKLGEPQEPTPRQSQQLQQAINAMPEHVRGSFANTRSVAWGDDTSFVVAAVNDDGKLGLVTHASSVRKVETFPAPAGR